MAVGQLCEFLNWTSKAWFYRMGMASRLSMREAELLMSALIVEVWKLRRRPLKRLLPLNVRLHSLSEFVLIFKRSYYILGHFYGSVFVSIHARHFLDSMYISNHLILQIYINPDFLANSSFVADLGHIVRCFDKTTKPRFKKAEEPQYIKFGSTRDNDKAYNIRFGQLKLTGWVIFSMKHRIVVNRIYLGLMLLRSLNLLWIVLSRRYWIKERAPIKWFLSVMSWAYSTYLALCYWQLLFSTSACCSRWRLCSEWLALQQSTWGIDPTWAQRSASWEPCVRILQKYVDLLDWLDPFRNKAVSDGAISFYLDHFRPDSSLKTYIRKLRHSLRSRWLSSHDWYMELYKNTQVSDPKEF